MGFVRRIFGGGEKQQTQVDATAIRRQEEAAAKKRAQKAIQEAESKRQALRGVLQEDEDTEENRLRKRLFGE